jgi:hypothetical protein
VGTPAGEGVAAAGGADALVAEGVDLGVVERFERADDP